MTFPEQAPAIEVEPLAEPTEPPWATDEEPPLAGEQPGPLSVDAIADRLVGLIQVPFAGVALIRGAHWAVSEEEARPIARNLAAVLPRTWWIERALNLSPWGLAGGHLVALIRVRLATDAVIAEVAAAAKEEPDAPRSQPSPPQPTAAVAVAQGDGPAPSGPRRVRRAAVRPDGEPAGRAGGVDSGDFEGAGNGPAV